MDVSYRRDKDHNYMILDAPGELTGEEYQVRMLVGNHIPHLLKCNRRMMDGKAVFFYEVTGMQPMFRVFEKRQINQEEMVELLQDIKEALENTQRYLLDGNQPVDGKEYGKSITDPCLGFEKTKELVLELAKMRKGA